MEFSHVVSDDRRLPGHGGADGYSLPGIDIVYDGPAEKKHILYRPKNSEQTTELDFTYFNAVYTVENALAKVKDEKGMKRVEKFLKQDICPDCGGTRLSEAARAPRLRDISLDQACEMTLAELIRWVAEVPGSLPEEMRPMAESICILPLTGLLLLYPPESGSACSLPGLCGTGLPASCMCWTSLLSDFTLPILRGSPVLWKIWLQTQAGSRGGQVIAQGTVRDLSQDPASKIGPFLSGTAISVRDRTKAEDLFALGRIHLSTSAIHTVKPLEADIPKGRLTLVTGVSGSGKTTLVLESLVPGLESLAKKKKLPDHVCSVEAPDIKQVKLIDATPIGINVRSTVATYANIHDELRKTFAKTPSAKEKGWKAGAFSYNTGALRCPVCDGTGVISLDVQFLPDVEIPCPQCRGSRYSKEAGLIRYINKAGASYSLPQLMSMDVSQALEACKDLKSVHQRLQILQDLGLGYLTLGEETPSLSGGEAQRLKLASEMGKPQADSVFIFDEPTIGLHPLDVQTLLGVFQTLISQGATVIVIEHDLDVIRNADYIIDMGPGGGLDGGRIVAAGTLEDIKKCSQSRTGSFL